MRLELRMKDVLELPQALWGRRTGARFVLER
jgi:hypothetical protein